MTHSTRIVVDGHARAVAAVEPQIRAELTKEYAARTAQAGFWARFRLKRQLEREIKIRVAKLAPPDALY